MTISEQRGILKLHLAVLVVQLRRVLSTVESFKIHSDCLYVVLLLTRLIS